MGSVGSGFQVKVVFRETITGSVIKGYGKYGKYVNGGLIVGLVAVYAIRLTSRASLLSALLLSA